MVSITRAGAGRRHFQRRNRAREHAGRARGGGHRVEIRLAGCIHLHWRTRLHLGHHLVFLYRLPNNHPNITDEEKQLISEGRKAEAGAEKVKPSLLKLLRMPETWGCALARLLTDPISYFLFFWTPSYLEKERGFDLKKIGLYAW